MLLQYVTSATVIPLSIAACRSTWSEPIPAVIASLRFGAAAIRSAVRYAGQNGCEITTSASGSCCSKLESGPSLSDVTTSSWPRSSTNRRRPSSPETQPSSSPGLKSTSSGVGVLCPPGYRSITGIASRGYDGG
jgi:hypothetical protein